MFALASIYSYLKGEVYVLCAHQALVEATARQQTPVMTAAQATPPRDSSAAQQFSPPHKPLPPLPGTTVAAPAPKVPPLSLAGVSRDSDDQPSRETDQRPSSSSMLTAQPSGLDPRASTNSTWLTPEVRNPPSAQALSQAGVQLKPVAVSLAVPSASAVRGTAQDRPKSEVRVWP